jgi:hypothetical protein
MLVSYLYAGSFVSAGRDCVTARLPFGLPCHPKKKGPPFGGPFTIATFIITGRSDRSTAKDQYQSTP